uniref:Albumin domain-containing protein n=1 Tax=Varanus komodoensis TaxID=61221 RepID=A0A8D2J2V8_VARKO
IQLSQKFPKADFPTILTLAENVTYIHEICCKDDKPECFLKRATLTAHICSHQDAISSKIKGCCEKPRLEQGECLLTVENEKPANLPLATTEYINKTACSLYADTQDLYLAQVLYEISRRYPEFSSQSLLRIDEVYEAALEKCCKLDNPTACLAQRVCCILTSWPDHALLKMTCNFQKILINYFFQNLLLVSFTKKAPQLSFEELYQYTKQLTHIASKCCPETARVLGAICQRHEEHYINKQVGQCCSDSYALRQQCFTDLGVDQEYAPAPFDPDSYTFPAELCSSNPEDQERNNQILISYTPESPLPCLSFITKFS